MQEIERFPVSRLTNATAVSDSAGLYGNVVIFTVQSEAAQSSDVHLFQAATKHQVNRSNTYNCCRIYISHDCGHDSLPVRLLIRFISFL